MYILVEKEMIDMEKIIDDYSDLVYRVAYTRLNHKENAEDIYQEVFLQLAKKCPKFISFEHLKAWLIRVTINKSKNVISSIWHKKVDRFDKDMPIHLDESFEVLEEVMRLKIPYRTVIYLYYYEGYKVAEIGKLLKKNESTIKTWLSRAKKVLKKSLEGGFDDESQSISRANG